MDAAISIYHWVIAIWRLDLHPILRIIPIPPIRREIATAMCHDTVIIILHRHVISSVLLPVLLQTELIASQEGRGRGEVVVGYHIIVASGTGGSASPPIEPAAQYSYTTSIRLAISDSGISSKCTSASSSTFL